MESENKLRDKIAQATKGFTTQIQFDQLVSSGFLKTLMQEFPDVSASELMYEWDSAKLRGKKMTRYDED